MKLKDQGRDGYYVLANRPSTAEQAAFGFWDGGVTVYPAYVNPFRDGYCGLVAVFTGVKRPPKKGEWYLSGAQVQAYRAPNDLGTSYPIAKLVAVETKIQTTIERAKR